MWKRHYIRRLAEVLWLSSLLVWQVGANKRQAADADAAPRDLNQLSLQVTALDTLYELDANASQLKQLESLADGTASNAPREQGPMEREKLANALRQLRSALLAPEPNDQTIAPLRTQVLDLAGAQEKALDDAVTPTPAAQKRAESALRLLSAGQVAAYLASHADQVADPAEHMVAALGELREMNEQERGGSIESAAADIARLAAGDEARAGALASRITTWLKENIDAIHALKDDEFDARRSALTASAQAIVGETPPMEVLDHWMQDQLATLLANPQALNAIRALANAKAESP